MLNEVFNKAYAEKEDEWATLYGSIDISCDALEEIEIELPTDVFGRGSLLPEEKRVAVPIAGPVVTSDGLSFDPALLSRLLGIREG